MNQLQLLLKNRFGPLFATQFFGALNDNIYRFALLVFVTFIYSDNSLTGDKTSVALIAGTFILPFFLVSGLAGQVCEKYEKSKLIRILKTSEILIVSLAGTALIFGNYYWLLITLFLMGTQSTFFGPLKYSILPQHMKINELSGANGLLQTGTYTAIIVGGFVGGLLMGSGTSAPLLVGITMIFVAILGRLSSQFIPTAPANDPTTEIKLNFIRSGWKSLKGNIRNKKIAILCILISVFWFMGASYLTLIPIYGKEILAATASNVSILTIGLALGIGIGSLLCEALGRSNIDVGLISFGIIIIFLVSLEIYWLGWNFSGSHTDIKNTATFLSPFKRFFLDLVILGIGGALYVIPAYAAVQNAVETRFRARSMAGLNILNAIFMVSSSLFMIFLDHIGIETYSVFAILAGVGLLTTIIAMFFSHELCWWLKPNT